MLAGYTILVIPMVAMAIVMCGGMLMGTGWALTRRRMHRDGAG